MSHVHVELTATGFVRLPASHVALITFVSVSFLWFNVEKNILKVRSVVVEELHDLYPSPNICSMKRIRLTGNVTHMSENRNIYKDLVRKS
jgi:hypothetical protein